MSAQPQEVLSADQSARDILQLDDAALAAAVGLDPAKLDAAPAPEPVKAEAVVEPVVEPVKEPEPIVEGEEVVEEEVVEEQPPKPALTKFQVFDTEGELEPPADLTFTFTANGKVRENVPLDKVILLAQQGYYNHEEKQRVEQTAREANAIKDEHAKLATVVEAFKENFDRIFTDDEYLLEVREEYRKRNTPEEKAKKLEKENARLRQERVMEAEGQTVHAAIQNIILPAFQRIRGESPTVSEHELLGRYTIDTAPYLVNGRLPASRIAEVQRLVEVDLAHWAKGLHIQRTEAEAEKTREVTKAKAVTAQTKRILARSAAPVAAGGSRAAEASKPDPTKTKLPDAASTQDWFNTIFPST
jgi:hypothetical protein